MENAEQNKDNAKFRASDGRSIGKRFGKEKPAIAGPGRPKLPQAVKDARAILKEASMFAADRLKEIVHSDDERNATRAAEIILSHVVPKLEEVTTINEHPLPGFDEKLLEARLRVLDAGPSSDHPRTGVAS